MTSGTLITAWLIAASGLGQNLPPQRIQEQNEKFHRWWQTDLVWKFDDLPTEGAIPEARVPYSGNIYLDRSGGTINALRKYDQAFHGVSSKAARHEQWDTTAYQRTSYQTRRVGMFRTVQVPVRTTPHWHGHCNGWTAAAMRHAEPQQSVVRNGITFTPADIKGLLAEIYIYQDTEDIGGEYGLVHPAELHVALTNWIGRYSHPIGMEASPGAEKWNYPIYAFASSHARRGARQVEVKTNARYAYFTENEPQHGPRLSRDKYFHYRLDLNERGEIVGGAYYRDSSRIDLLWIPVGPKRGGQPGNERGNPHVDIDQVLAIWRDSVPQELLSQWVAVDTDYAQPPRPPQIIASAEEPQAAAEEEALADATAGEPAVAPPPSEGTEAGL